jgi:hypothetical protein
MKRTTKRYVITTSALNCYSYRVLSTGVDFSQYNNNPILLWMHIRADNNTTNQILPIGRVVEIRLEGDKWTGQPEFDENDAFAMSVYGKYEAGVLNMLSLGANPLEVSDAPEYMLPGQINPTVLKCKVTDVSCVDVGGNPEALPVQLYDATGCMIALSFTSISSYLKLAKTAAASASSIEHKPVTLAIVNNGIAAGKFNQQEATALLSAGNDEKTVNEIIKTVKRTKINPDRLAGKIPAVLNPLLSKSWSELSNGFGDKIGMLREHAPDVYKAKYFEKHDRLPAERNGKPL